MSRKTRLIITLIGILLTFALLLTSCVASAGAGIINAAINENGELVLYYDDGREQNLGTVVGSDGKDGADGKDGIDGKDGKDGIDGKDGKDGIDGADGKDGESTAGSGGSQSGSSITAASTKGLRSAVSIVCSFTATVQTGWYPGNTTTKEYSSAGSGVIYEINKSSGDAFIITNYHVVYDASSNTANGISDDISVYIYGSQIKEKAIKATYVGGSLYYDIAVLRIDGSEILRSSDTVAASIASSDDVVVGDTAIAIGNAKGYGISASSGIVSVDSEYITMTAVDGKTKVAFRVIRVDAAVNAGNSGGGLYDKDGCLIGIVNAKIVDDGVENIGYAIPSNVAVSIAENIIDYCYDTEIERVQKAVLGVTVTSTNSSAAYDPEAGVIKIRETVSIYDIAAGSLADGVHEIGDILVSATIGDKTIEITRQYQMLDMMLDVRPGDIVHVNILRGGEEMTLTFNITEDCLAEY